jgi:multiple sugar transport system substrate-binding protein
MELWIFLKYFPTQKVNKRCTTFITFMIITWSCIACGEKIPGIATTQTRTQPASATQIIPSDTRLVTTHQPSATFSTPITKINLEADELKGAIIEFWHPWSGETGEMLQTIVEEFNLTNEWGILVVPFFIGTFDQMDEQLSLAIEEGDAPDLAIGFKHQVLAWDSIGKIVDLNTYIADPVWGFSLEEQADFYPVFWEMGVHADQYLGLIAQASGQMLFYNQTWASELGFMTPPTSPEQFYGQACAAVLANFNDENEENNRTGGWIISTDYAAMLGWIYAFGGDITKNPARESNESVYQFSKPEIQEAFTFLRRMYDDGCAWVAESQYTETEFVERLGLFSVGSMSDLAQQVNTFRKAGKRDEWTVIPFPSTSKNPIFPVYGPLFTILESSPEEQLASWLWIKWLSNPVNQAQLITSSGLFPLRESTRLQLQEHEQQNPQWGAAVELLPLAKSEPSYISWRTVRWALADASTQLFRSYFTPSQIPTLLEFLDQTAAELHLGTAFISQTHTPTSTTSPEVLPTPSFSASRTFTLPLTPSLTATTAASPGKITATQSEKEAKNTQED